MNTTSTTTLQRIWLFILRENLHRLLIIILVVSALSTIGIKWLENIPLSDGAWWSVVTLTTVGYGDVTPQTLTGRLLAFLLMLIGIGLFGTFSATIASVLVHQKMKEDQGMSEYKELKDHIILSQWNEHTRFIIQELRSDPKTAPSPIALIADIERKPINDNNLYFIKGDVNEETLERANLAEAKTVVILGDQELEVTARDGKAVLSALMIESMNHNAYSIVQLADHRNVQHAKRAQVDEIIVSSELSSGIIARATLDHGMAGVISTLLKNDDGDELYKIPVPLSMVGQRFIDLFIGMKQTYRSTVVALQKADTQETIFNPEFDLRINQNDHLIIISSERA